MKKNLVFLAVAAIALTLIITGCSKKNDTPAYSAKQISGTYKLTASTATVPGFGDVDMMDAIEECAKDDLQTFQEDGNYQYVDAGVTCSGSNDEEGHFLVKGNLLILNPDANTPDTATIKSFSGTKLILSTPVDYGGLTIVGNVTLTKQ